jgi:transcription termination factor Rho
VTDTDLITAGESTDSETPSNSVTTDTSPAKTHGSDGSLSTMVLPELRALANQAGVKGTSGMRKNELITAIREIRGQANGASAGSSPEPAASTETPAAQGEQSDSSTEAPRRERRGASRDAGSATREEQDRDSQGSKEGPKDGPKENTGPRSGSKENAATDEAESGREGRQPNKSDERGSDAGGDQSGDQQGSGNQQGRGGSNQQDDDGDGRGGRRGRRFRDRDRRRRGERSGETGGGGGEAELRDDDVVQPVAGILDVLDNYAFVRTSGYLAGPHDVYVSMNMVRKNGLRRGDAVTGAVRVPKEGEQPNQRQKFNPLVRLDSVNGGPVEDVRKRPDFTKLTPLYPNQRLRLETTPDRLTTRVIDLIMPIGKGQRALIVSPPKAGKTTIMQDIANAIAKNNPECHLMVVLVDERPEEVTDMTRSVKGEVIASTFDRPPSDHTQAAELAIERAKRLVEQGKDVVVLLDSITRLGRAYNNASPASGRILSGGVDSTALYPPKRFLGAARNIEEGGSLTIIATAMVETGSTGDTVIFEEFKGTGNAELKLDRKISERRVFPAVDVNPSGTRKDELLLSPDEFSVVHKLRRVLSGLDSHQAIDLLMSQLRKTKTNYEFLVQVSKTTPGNMDND